MKKIFHIALMLQQEGWEGGCQYIKSIIVALNKLPPVDRSSFELYLICSKAAEKNEYQTLMPELKIRYAPVKATSKLPIRVVKRGLSIFSKNIYQYFYQTYFDAYYNFFKKLEIDFVYPYFLSKNIKSPFQSAAWCYDLQHKYFPHYFTPGEIKSRDDLFEKYATFAPSIVVSSKTSKSDFIKFYPWAKDRVKVLSFRTYVLEGLGEQKPLKTVHKYNIPDRFFLLSNQFWLHKNHLVVFRALKILQEKKIFPAVVCTGHLFDYRKPNHIDFILQTMYTLGIANQIYLLGVIPKIEQIQLLRYSLAVIQPSLFEGWSTVVEEARIFGKPIILSDIPLHREQGPPKSVFFNSNSAEELASVLCEKWGSSFSGLDLEAEAIAKDNSIEESKIFAYQFLEIARGKNKY